MEYTEITYPRPGGSARLVSTSRVVGPSEAWRQGGTAGQAI